MDDEVDHTEDIIQPKFEIELETLPQNTSEIDVSGQDTPSYDDGPIDDSAGYYEVPFCRCLSYEYFSFSTRFWHKWFRVDTRHVGTRLYKSLIFFSPALIESIRTVPDIYGPFWIYTTLAFMLGTSSNLDAYLKSSGVVY